jgi:hypothetical protein|tara:strand:+ start:201 stop:383 length:183 start_codon:yes stop_codon:yes gene_type:complete
VQIVEVGGTKYIVLATVPVDSPGYNSENLKDEWGADAILRNGDTLYPCQKTIDAEFEDIE